MRRPSEDQAGGQTPSREATSRQAKKPYRAPRLVTYGNLPQLALAKGGTKNDGGAASKV
jgi:hypothetical protein